MDRHVAAAYATLAYCRAVEMTVIDTDYYDDDGIICRKRAYTQSNAVSRLTDKTSLVHCRCETDAGCVSL